MKREENVQKINCKLGVGEFRLIEILVEHWVFIHRLVMLPGHVIKHVGHVAITKILLAYAN